MGLRNFISPLPGVESKTVDQKLMRCSPYTPTSQGNQIYDGKKIQSEIECAYQAQRSPAEQSLFIRFKEN